MSDDNALTAIHRTLIGFNKPAKRSSDAMLVATFVDSAPLSDLLKTPNNQVIYRRRGTGKTHALKFLAEEVESKGEHPIYLDLRSVGPNGSIYADTQRPPTERASTLLLDVLGASTTNSFDWRSSGSTVTHYSHEECFVARPPRRALRRV
jgi:hypothetical protein